MTEAVASNSCSLLTGLLGSAPSTQPTFWKLEDFVPEESFIVLAFGETLDGAHEDVVIAEEVLEKDLTETVPKTGVVGRV